MEEPPWIQKELEKKDFDLKLGQERLKETDFALQRALGDKEAALAK